MATRLGNRAVLVALSASLAASTAVGQTDKARFVILLDNSNSMTENLDVPAIQTHGDGSELQPGCDIDGKSTAGWAYDDSKLFLAKSAVVDTISAFGAAEFALATYSRTLLGQPCNSDGECTSILAGASCADVPGVAGQKYCARHGGDSYRECSTGSGCVRCASPSDINDLVFDWGAIDCLNTRCSFAQGCIGGHVLVGFPAAGSSNLQDLYRWIDGKEDLPPFGASSNRELRAVTMTPIGSALDSLRAWLVDASRTNVGPGAGLLSNDAAARDPRLACRPYSIILITDGEDTCSPSSEDPINAAGELFKLGINVYVVGFGAGNSTGLTRIAMAGSGDTRPAYFASNRSDLIASLGDIIMNALPKPRCVCNAICYDEAAAFPLKGQPCSVGIGRCKREGVYACNSAGDGVVCAEAAVCGATPLLPGTPVPEQCGTLPGCLAPTAADCADEDCDGLIDEDLSCSCSATPELCNGLDDNCDGIVDNIAAVACGLDLGACKPGTTVCAPDGAGGFQVSCQGASGPSAEVCDGVDNDCNGLVDDLARVCYPEGVVGCAYDATAQVWSCAGACKTGMQACSAAAWQPCVGMVVPATEIACDGVDNDCNGQVDENNPTPVGVCYPPGVPGCDAAKGVCVGECAFGHLACAANKMGLACAGALVPIPELCNGKDDDCDGQVDEDFPTLGRPCNEESCQGAGQIVCNATGTDVECTVKAAGPTPEVCDGRDNDCDGQVDEAPGAGEAAMPGIGVPCGSNVGECRAGLSTCVGGKIVCSAAAGPTPEICDGKDNDCNGRIDDGVVIPAEVCNPEGLASGQPLVGECQPGTFVCRGNEGWKCQGGVGPVAEICDGKDNDCDGVPDNDARCAPGFICLGGECVQTCQASGEFYRPCPTDRFCKDGACLVKPCALKPCATGEVCRSTDGVCVDPCSGVDCLPGAECRNGVCVDCYTTGCPSGERCIARKCTVDPCEGKACAARQFCYAGACVASCAGVLCSGSRVCVGGNCVESGCPTVCASDFFCDPALATCRPKPCAGIACPTGQVCVNATGTCADNPCEKVHCREGESCVVGDDGSPDCTSPVVPAIARSASTSGSGAFGCTCAVADSPAHPSGGRLLRVLGLALAGFLVARRRRR